MPDSSNFQTVGSPISNASVGSIGTSFLGKKKNDNIDLRFRYRVTNLFFNEKGDCTHLEYEDTFQNYGQSTLGTTNNNSIAYTSDSNIQDIPFIGEYIDLFTGPDPYGKAADKSSFSPKQYWKSNEGSLNIWNTFEGDNINLDPTVPGQATNTQMASLNVVNYNKSLMGMIPKLT
jgi:hypothetical protein